MSEKSVFMVGFGSQGSAWAECLRRSEWKVKVYLSRRGKSFERAVSKGFEPRLLESLSSDLSSDLNGAKSETSGVPVAMLCPDSEIAPIYCKHLSALKMQLQIILAHGFAIYSGDLQPQNPQHHFALLAPKAIGPKLLEHFQTHFPQPHTLAAAISDPKQTETLITIAEGLGFHRNSLIPASFQQETIGDLMSEQGLLCGGIFNLMQWTMEAMRQAEIPEPLILQECLTELELVAGLIREKGPSEAFRSISQAAQCGTIAMARRMQESGFQQHFDIQMKSILNHKFSAFFHSQDWQDQAKELAQNLSHWKWRQDP